LLAPRYLMVTQSSANRQQTITTYSDGFYIVYPPARDVVQTRQQMIYADYNWPRGKF